MSQDTYYTYTLHTNLYGDLALGMASAMRALFSYLPNALCARPDLLDTPQCTARCYEEVTLCSKTGESRLLTVETAQRLAKKQHKFSLLSYSSCYRIFLDPLGELCLDISKCWASDRKDMCLGTYGTFKDFMPILLKEMKSLSPDEDGEFTLTAKTYLQFKELKLEWASTPWLLKQHEVKFTHRQAACFLACIWAAWQQLETYGTWFAPHKMYAHSLEEVEAVLKWPRDNPLEIAAAEVEAAEEAKKTQKFFSCSQSILAEVEAALEKQKSKASKKLLREMRRS